MARKAHDDPMEVEVCFELAGAYETAGKQEQGAEYHEFAVQMTKRILPKLDGASKNNLSKFFDHN